MLLESARPTRISRALAKRTAADLFGLDARADPLPGEYDDNFRLTTAAGQRFVLKLMHPSRERELIDLQCRALQHIRAHTPSLMLPRPIASLAGDIVSEMPVDGVQRFVWLLDYIDGKPLVDARPHDPLLLESLGRLAGAIDVALIGFPAAAAKRELKWDSKRALWTRDYVHLLDSAAKREIVERFLNLFETEVLPRASELRHSVIHGDANDHNVITRATRANVPQAVSLIDFGDIHYGITVSELAIAAAYAVLEKDDPLTAATHIVAGYHSALPLAQVEVAVLFPLIATRLCVSVVNAALQKSLAPSDEYVTITERPAWAALEKLAAVSPRFAHYKFRGACGFPIVPHLGQVIDSLRAAATVPLMAGMPNVHVYDLSVGSLLTGADPKALEEPTLTSKLREALQASGATIGIGRYDEPRALYTSPLFTSGETPAREGRTVHLGLDLFADAGTPVHAPLGGTIHALANNARPQDYGPVIILRHLTDGGVAFFSLYGHLSAESLQGRAVGDSIDSGQCIGWVGTAQENGGWPPHVHFQLITDLLERGVDFPGVARASERALWLELSPDPNLLARIPRERFPDPLPALESTQQRRAAHLGHNLSISYRQPLRIVRGWRQYLYDDTGRAYLDTYNNVPLVGHSHPKVVEAIQRQVALLNTNTRYLHENVVRYAERLTALLPEPLRVCYFLNSASEANELALRLARAYSGRRDVIVLDHAYHGHTNTLIDISPYKFAGPGGAGRPSWVHVAPLADDYRGRYRRNDPEAGRKYAAHVGELLSAGVRPAAFIAESLPSVGGQIVFPPNYLAHAYEHVRAAGGLCVADEVQVGFGRLGRFFWGFESQNVVPDIVVLGKPIGNAFPLAAVVTTEAVAAAFDNGMEFFSTFGGNPVACAAGLAVLDVLDEEELPRNAERVGAHLLERLRGLAEHRLVGDVRGMGLFLGVELVRNPETLEPATEEASYIVNRLRDNGILTGVDGPFENVIKIRPPLCVTDHDAELFAATLGEILLEDGLA